MDFLTAAKSGRDFKAPDSEYYYTLKDGDLRYEDGGEVTLELFDLERTDYELRPLGQTEELEARITDLENKVAQLETLLAQRPTIIPSIPYYPPHDNPYPWQQPWDRPGEIIVTSTTAEIKHPKDYTSMSCSERCDCAEEQK